MYYYPTEVGAEWVVRRTNGPGQPAQECRYVVKYVHVKGGTTLVLTEREAGAGDPADPHRMVTGPSSAVSADGVTDFGEHGRGHTPPLPVFKAGAKAGDRWTRVATSGVGRRERTQERRVAGVEAVEVPAGRFAAVRVEVTETRGGNGFRHASTEWHAPGVGRVKLTANNLVEELVSFTRGNGKLPPEMK